MEKTILHVAGIITELLSSKTSVTNWVNRRAGYSGAWRCRARHAWLEWVTSTYVYVKQLSSVV